MRCPHGSEAKREGYRYRPWKVLGDNRRVSRQVPTIYLQLHVSALQIARIRMPVCGEGTCQRVGLEALHRILRSSHDGQEVLHDGDRERPHVQDVPFEPFGRVSVLSSAQLQRSGGYGTRAVRVHGLVHDATVPGRRALRALPGRPIYLELHLCGPVPEQYVQRDHDVVPEQLQHD